MPQALPRETEKSMRPGERDRQVKILAKSIFKELRANGYDARQIVALSSELISLITGEIRPDSK